MERINMKLGKLYEDMLDYNYGCILHCTPELIMLQETLRYSLVINITEYSLTQHKLKDGYIEDWLNGKLKIFQTEKELTKWIRQQRERDQYVT